MKGKNIAEIAEEMERERQARNAYRRGDSGDSAFDEGQRCPLCRRKVKNGAAFCTHCGRKLNG